MPRLRNIQVYTYIYASVKIYTIVEYNKLLTILDNVFIREN